MSDFPFRAAIFDLDGTLIDSMTHWKEVLGEFLRRRGITPDPEAEQRLEELTVRKGIIFIKEKFSLKESLEALREDINQDIRRIYTHKSSLKSGVREYLESLRRGGIPMGIATTAVKDYAREALERFGAADYFSFVLTDEDVGKGKNHPDLYLAAAEKLGFEPSDCAVFEDSYPFAMVAKQVGFCVYAVRDACNREIFDEFAAAADGVSSWGMQ